jgi:acyl-coenzyme A synthetase/AMP-(fatty) acid ligase
MGMPLAGLGAGDAGPSVLSARGALSRDALSARVCGLAGMLDVHPAKRWALVCDDAGWFAAGLIALASRQRITVLPQAPQAGSLKAAGVEVDAVLTDRPAAFAGYDVLATEDHAPSTAPCGPDDDALIEFYTSGSSGAPKCVPKRYGQLRREVETLERQWGAALGRAAIAGTVPHHHLYGLLFRILWPLHAGRPFHAGISQQPADLRAVAAQGPCVLVSSPAFLSRTDPAELPAASTVAALFCSGAPLADETARGLAEGWGRAAIEVYGSTETGGVAWRAWDGEAGRPWWRALPGVDAELREEDAGTRLWVRSGWTWGRDWMATGDRARAGADGRFALQGRVDDVLKFEDKRVSLSEMRARLREHAWVSDARLILLPGQRAFIGAVVVLQDEGRAALAAEGKLAVNEALKAWLRQSYEALLLPRKWRYPEALPDNAMGKTEQAKLLSLFGGEEA